ncbi:MAG TPA: outer membrane beta-barrel protein [Vicinamibacterales bacterium]|jgi:opacity protein-like surface antigen|nr:outer membrane beta-barrel protein [Vicinamibacterales bacterium]
MNGSVGCPFSRAKHTFAVAVVVGASVFCLPTQSAAQAFVYPFLGYNFSGDSGCPEITDCEDKNLNWGVSLGAVGGIVGAELEFAHTDNFFGETIGTKTSVTTIMGHFLLAPKFGPIQPYGLAGLGVIRSKAEVTAGTSVDNGENDFGYDIGGGLMVFFGEHVGARADIRYFRSFSAVDLLDLEVLLGEDKLDFGRFSGGVVFKF